jgi:phosphoribosylanthranilate isomerase
MTRTLNNIPQWGVNFLQKHGERKGVKIKRIPIRNHDNHFTVVVEANNNAQNEMHGLQIVQAFVLFQNETNKAIQEAWTWDVEEWAKIATDTEIALAGTIQFKRLNS